MIKYDKIITIKDRIGQDGEKCVRWSRFFRAVEPRSSGTPLGYRLLAMF
jgi:hypothetical protein